MTDSLTFPFSTSFILHGLFLGLYFYWGLISQKEQLTVIADVTLIESLKSAPISAPVPVRRAPPRRLSTWDFLKMALPSAPAQPEGPKLKELSIPKKLKKNLYMPEKLKEKKGELLTKRSIRMDLQKSQDRSLAQVASSELKRERMPAQVLDAPIRLEEVGVKRAPSLPPELEWREGDLPARTVTSLKEIKALASKKVYRPVAPEALPSEATRKPGGIASKLLARILPTAPALVERRGAGPRRIVAGPPVIESVAVPNARKKKVLERPRKEKPIEIVGPLSRRKVIKMSVPAFPDWLKDRGTGEINVSIRFLVDSRGNVLRQMSVARTSGYRALDKLVMDHLRKWLFASLGSTAARKDQWGVITFRFILE